MQARKGRKVTRHCVVPMSCGRRRSKSRLAKAAGAEPSAKMRDQKLYAGVARSTCGGQNVKNTSLMSGALLEVELCPKCTLLWREVHLEVKSGKS